MLTYLSEPSRKKRSGFKPLSFYLTAPISRALDAFKLCLALVLGTILRISGADEYYEATMEGVRKRKSADDVSGADAGATGGSWPYEDDDHKTKSASIDRGFTRLIGGVAAAAAALLLLAALFPGSVPTALHGAVDGALAAAGLETRAHAVVIDAGSTGSRVLAFTFHRGLLSGELTLDDELWHEVKPGLSSYANDPAAGAKSVDELLELARKKIPKANWDSTPLTLKATAGLRLLKKEEADAIIEEVEKTLRTSGFKPEETLIEIMNPTDEGIFAWFTVNFLLGKLSKPLEESSVTLDLGGGSTQITFAPDGPVHGIRGRKHFMHNATIMGQPSELYSHSYLGLGLMAAREAIFLASSDSQDKLQLSSPCVTHQEPLQWEYKGKKYTISSSQASFQNCIAQVNKVVNSANVHTPKDLAQKEIVAFSYFYDRAVERRLIQGFAGQIPVSSFIYEAQRACDPYSNSQFFCVDLAYISALLTKGYGLPPDKVLNLYKKIDGHETSWALGLAYSILQ